MAVRAKPYTLQTPLNIEDLDEMLDILFQDVRNGNLEVEAVQITGLEDIVQGDLIVGGDVAGTLELLSKDTNATRYVSNTGTDNDPAWAQVALATGVSGDLPYANLTPASAASLLLGRGSAAGGGDWQEITLGTALSMAAQVLNVTPSGVAGLGYWSPLTNGDLTFPEVIFALGDTISVWTPL